MTTEGQGIKGAKHRLGAEGERIAKAFLTDRGYQIIRENFTTPLGEIDLIAREGDLIVFVEVKTRASREYGPPQSSVTLTKQRQIIRVAELFLQREGLSESPCRFDVVAVVLRGGEGERPEILLIRDAFSVGGTPLY